MESSNSKHTYRPYALGMDHNCINLKSNSPESYLGKNCPKCIGWHRNPDRTDKTAEDVRKDCINRLHQRTEAAMT